MKKGPEDSEAIFCVLRSVQDVLVPEFIDISPRHQFLVGVLSLEGKKPSVLLLCGLAGRFGPAGALLGVHQLQLDHREVEGLDVFHWGQVAWQSRSLNGACLSLGNWSAA